MQAIADGAMTWTCPKCGKRPWRHAESCSCGAERPAPPHEPAPADKPITEAPIP